MQDIAIWSLVVVQLGIIGAGIYFRSYLGKKGENLATREDIRDLTRRVEEVREEFTRRQDLERHQLAQRLEEHRLSLQTELPIYRDLWEKIQALEGASDELQIAYGAAAMSDGTEDNRTQAHRAFVLAKDQFNREMRLVQPFMAPSVYQELFRAFITVRAVAAETEKALAGGDRAKLQVITDGITKTSAAFARLATAIRGRLFPAVGYTEPAPAGGTPTPNILANDA